MDKATPRPWAATTRRGSWDWVVYSVADPNIEICQPFHDGTDDNPTGEANAALIVHAVNNIDRLTAERDGLRKALEEIASPNELASDPATFGKFPESYLYFAQETARAALAASDADK